MSRSLPALQALFRNQCRLTSATEVMDQSTVYVGGSSTAVRCLACSATSTTGSWRRGWLLPDGRHINLCNRRVQQGGSPWALGRPALGTAPEAPPPPARVPGRRNPTCSLPSSPYHAYRCGQRWQKAGRPNSLAELHAAEERKARSAGAAASAGAKRPAAPQLSHGLAAAAGRPLAGVLSGAKRPRLPLGLAPLAPPPRQRRFTEEDEEESSLECGEGGGYATAPEASSQVTPSTSDTDSFSEEGTDLDAFQASEATDAAALAPRHAHQPVAAPGGRRFVSYCIQRIASGRTNHAAFWLQNDRGDSLVAVVVSEDLVLLDGGRLAACVKRTRRLGWFSSPHTSAHSHPHPRPMPPSPPPSPLQGTDARLSGHFTYTTTPQFMELGLAPALRCTNRGQVGAWLAVGVEGGAGRGEQQIGGPSTPPGPLGA